MSIGTEPLVCAVVVTWNGGEQAVECIRSVQESAYPNLPVVVVDNHSDDDTATRIVRACPECTVIEQEQNQGFAGGANVGFREGIRRGAEYLLLLNQDVVVAREAVPALVRSAAEDPRIAAVGGKVLFYDEPQRIWSAGAGSRLFWSHTGSVSFGYGQTDSREHNRTRDVGYVSGCCMLLRASVIHEIGGFDPRFFMYAEDFDWCERARRAGYRIRYSPQAVIFHRVSVERDVKRMPVVLYYATRNHLYSAVGWRSGFFRYFWIAIYGLLVIPLRCLLLLAWQVVRLRTVRFQPIGSVLRGLRDFLANRTGKIEDLMTS
ncbi:MAG: glycosyltransferase family 2 protein [Terriglobia bacterium]